MMLVIDSFLYILVAIGIDVIVSLPAVRRVFNRSCPLPANYVPLEDQHVIDEKNRVDMLDPSTQMVCVNRIRKVYNRTVHAVRGISFAAAEGHVFGLLGVNGA